VASWGWQDDAECRGEGLWLFFGQPGERTFERDRRERAAKAICAFCPVRRECLDYALHKPEGDGLWGGLNEDERAAERRRRQRRAHRESVTRPEADDVPDKRCRACQQDKPATDYGPARQNADGLNSACKACTAAMAKERRHARKAVAS
jgi:WhiB family redox-sensing transcriptional regulator